MAKQTRRSISVRGTTYDHLREYGEAQGRSMSDIVEELLARLFESAPADIGEAKAKSATPLKSVPAAPAKADDELVDLPLREKRAHTIAARVARAAQSSVHEVSPLREVAAAPAREVAHGSAAPVREVAARSAASVREVAARSAAPVREVAAPAREVAAPVRAVAAAPARAVSAAPVRPVPVAVPVADKPAPAHSAVGRPAPTPAETVIGTNRVDAPQGDYRTIRF
jgi:hypothetical protein